MSIVTKTELWRMSATELAEAIRFKEVSSQEVIDAHLRRIEAVNPAVNAVTVVLCEQALEAAKVADRAVAACGDLPPFHGVPFTIKSNIDVARTPTTWGARAKADAYPTRDAPVVERLRTAGAIPIGRTNMPTGAIRWDCESELWGRTLNPWDRSRTLGASSGGEAAALATGMSPLGLGNDTLGSLRVPAQCCGIAALKPTLGRIPDATTIEPVDMPIAAQLAGVQGPLARRVADLRAAFDVLAGPSWRDPWSVPAPLRGPEPVRPIRVALVIDPAGQGTAKQVQDGVRNAATALQDAGYIVEEVEPPAILAAATTLVDMMDSDTRAAWHIISPGMPANTRRFLEAWLEFEREPEPIPAIQTTQTYMIRTSLMRAWGEFQQAHPLIVGPIFTDVPFEAGRDLSRAEVSAIVRGLRMTLAVNALALPAVALPVGIGEGLPQTVQVIGPRYREDLCLDAASALEDRLGIITPIDPRSEARQSHEN
jgi:amidase